MNSSCTTLDFKRSFNMKTDSKGTESTPLASKEKNKMRGNCKSCDKQISVVDIAGKDTKVKLSDKLLRIDNRCFMTTELTDFNKKEDYTKTALKILILEVLESDFISKGTMLKITPEGLVGSKRKEKDGNVFFGTESREVTQSE